MGEFAPGSMVKRFKAYCFELVFCVMARAGSIPTVSAMCFRRRFRYRLRPRRPLVWSLEEEFLANVWDLCQPFIVRNLGSYSFVVVIPVLSQPPGEFDVMSTRYS